MRYQPLGATGLQVSQIGLGTMTWGQQNTESEAHAQLDRAIAAGINLIDTAEMYPIPPRAETQGLTEQYIGSWLQQRGGRDQVLIATKVLGPARAIDYVRGGNLRLDRKNIEAAIDASLKRLRCDYVDLYQLHWPDRSTNFFGRLGYVHEPDETAIPIEETLTVLGDLVRSGKIRHIGVSNETPWGVMRFLRAAEELSLPRIASIQNPYSLLNRSFEVGLAEVSHREQVPLLAYSPMAFGVLSGKYVGGAKPAGARLSLFGETHRYTRYSNPQADGATEAYVRLAREHGLDPAQMALAYVNSRPFCASTLIGATTVEQLDADIASIDLELSAEVLEGIEAIHAATPNPGP